MTGHAPFKACQTIVNNINGMPAIGGHAPNGACSRNMRMSIDEPKIRFIFAYSHQSSPCWTRQASGELHVHAGPRVVTVPKLCVRLLWID